MSITLDGTKGISQNTTEVTKIPTGTTAQRPASPEAGMIRFNTEIGQIEGYNSNTGEWQPIHEFFQRVVATGGTIIDFFQGGIPYRVHAFTTDGTFEVTHGGDVEYLIVAGGGAGGSRRGGGGGRGGFTTGGTNPGSSGLTNTGGGGGGANSNSATETGQDGGSGIVLIRYRIG